MTPSQLTAFLERLISEEITISAMIWGPPGYLDLIQQQGFQTFDHVIDESYDSEQNNDTRLSMIIEQVNKLKNIKLTDDETVKRTTHNHNLFFDTTWSKQQFYKNLFSPMLELLS